MKNVFTITILTLLTVIGGYAQKTNSMVIFVEDAKPFYAVINGIKQNVQPKTNVKITGLTNPSVSIKIIFSDSNIPDISKRAWFESMGKEATYRIVHTNKKGYKLRFFGEVSLMSAVANENQSVIEYHTVEPSATFNETVTTTTTTTTNGNSINGNDGFGSEDVNIDLNIGGFGIDMNVNVNEGSQSNASTTTTTTTTSSSSTTGFDLGIPETVVVYVPNYGGVVGCPIPQETINSIKSSIESESFSDDKMNVAKQALRNRCIKVSQVRELMSVFDFEDNKLELAKYAYERTYDVDNYYLVNKEFDFSSTKAELNNYINSK